MPGEKDEWPTETDAQEDARISVAGLIQEARESRVRVRELLERVDTLTDDRDEFRDLLRDLVMLESEESAIGGGPGFKERHAKAWAAAREKFEP